MDIPSSCWWCGGDDTGGGGRGYSGNIESSIVYLENACLQIQHSAYRKWMQMMPRGPDPNADDFVEEGPERRWTEACGVIGWHALPAQRKAEMWFRRGACACTARWRALGRHDAYPRLPCRWPCMSASSVASRGQEVHHAGAAVRGEQGIGIDSQHIMHARLYPAAAGCVSCTSYSSFRFPRFHAFS